LVAILILSVACNQNSNSPRNNNLKSFENEEDGDTTDAFVLKFSNSLFSVPSPHEASIFIKKNGVKYDNSLMNSVDNISNYSTSFKKALNLGIYGSNLGYLNVYEQIPESFKYFAAIKKLSNELGLNESFDDKIITRIENNLDNKDSLLYYISKIYQDANNYLNKNQRDDIGGLVITGGFIESLYILTKCAALSGSYEIRNRIGDQKHPLDNLIDLLSPFYFQSDEYSELIDKLVDLAYEFDGIIYNYIYEDPIIDTLNKMTIINSESRIVISDYHLNIISEKIDKIRSAIIN
ncbi:hypothetical protein ACFLTE_10505, partial [Bacteroidota bacterium]